MKFSKTKRNTIISRYKGKESKYPYFFYEEDPSAEEYSKFVTDELYADGNVQWYYIVDNSTIVGLCALKEEGEELWIKFIEISTSSQGHGYGAEAVNYIIDKTDKRIIRLYPKNTELGNGFYKQLGFKWLGDSEEMYYLNWGDEPSATE
jgi:RimJ/RimL family protein N-acetyltransferase